ncbi:serine palmitoyltransferase [Candidatus Nitrospira neomarina]|uniref:Aminotransferase class I/II-fold pyridoxal phosphate-dependent enzyme n=1 Tax=Candidatus Nitrospira neomarina TaxID=3020899 RepID=A0AA96GMS4_9BACT|nr:aminotransferase class I/II-fold pyridoxal phosphate-dependent enzyme [Candidatus Nitrospira neomarina]WNM60386.1 aminotransferase class I/II-fold pyridoxal phosphate-dependent enzyme [Candidatus Nitrospira neomarina]
MSLFDKFLPIQEARNELLKSGVNPFHVTVEKIISPTEAIINGRKTILVGTNNYLGLTFHPDSILAGQQALAQEGTGTTGSRMANGSFASHKALEVAIAEFYGAPYAIVFSTGYQANLGVLSALAGPGDTILIDGDSHASIYDGCRLGGAEVIRFKHNDVADLEKRLRRLGDRSYRTLIVVEGIYSMLGDRAPLAEIVEVKKKYGATLIVDEAHSLGVLGQHGRGLAEETGVEQDVDCIVGTFSKSLGSTGGFGVSFHPEFELIRYTSRPYIFTASPCPSVVASTRATICIIQTHPELRQHLWDNSRNLYEGLTKSGYRLGAEVGPIIAAMVPNKELALAMWQQLLENGIYVNLMIPPATPNGECLLRCSVSAAHTHTQIEKIISAFDELSHGTQTHISPAHSQPDATFN